MQDISNVVPLEPGCEDLMSAPYGLKPVDNCQSCEFRKHRLFCNLQPESLSSFDPLGSITYYPKGAVLFVEDQEARNVIVLCAGRVKLSTTSKDGRNLILRIGEPGSLLGMSAALSGTAYELTAEAVTPCMVKSIGRDAFLDFLKRHGEASLNAASALSNDYQSAFRDARSLVLAKSSAARFAGFLIEQSTAQRTKAATGNAGDIRMKLGLTHAEIAEMTGVSRETITRLFTRFKERRLISVQGATLTINRPSALEAMAA